MVFDGTLDECIRQFMSKPASQHHLYEIHTAPQAALITAVLSPSKSLNSPGYEISSNGNNKDAKALGPVNVATVNEGHSLLRACTPTAFRASQSHERRHEIDQV